MKVKHRKTPFKELSILAVIALVGAPLSLLAAGFRLPNQDPEAIARGNAFAATADNPSAIFYNPAGITQLEGHQLSLGVYTISPSIDYVSPSGARANNDAAFQFIPQFYYTSSPEDSKWSYGIGLFAPYGLSADYGRDTSFSTLAIDGELSFITLNPTVAYQVTPELSLGFGIALNYSEISLTRALGLSADDSFRFEGDDFSIGFNAGALWQPHDQWSFGLNFRSATEMEYSGSSRVVGIAPAPVNSSTQTSLEFPLNITLGTSFRPDDHWNIEVGLDWTDWDAVNVSTLEGTPFGDVPFPFNYESGFTYQFGVTYRFDSGHFVSAGYLFNENNVPDATLNPLNPDDGLHILSFGFGKRGEVHSWALGYQYAFNAGERSVANSLTPSATGESANGNFDITNHAFNISYRYSF